MKTIFIALIILWLAVLIIILPKLNWFLALFIIFTVGERCWETFLAAKQNILDRNSKFDWLFKIIGLCYVILIFATLLEFVYSTKETNYRFMLLGFFIFSLALFLRLSAVRALGGGLDTDMYARDNFAGQKILVRHGPYKYLRHPIYLGAILECLSIPLVYSCRYTFLFALLFCLPLLVLRAYLEEQESVKIFGQDYLKYKSEVKAFLPLAFKKLFKSHIRIC